MTDRKLLVVATGNPGKLKEMQVYLQDRLLKELGSEQNREAQFVCAIAIARPDGTIALQVEGICRGEILHTPRGTGGFGYDPIFYVPAQQQTFAEMTPDIKRVHSHRGRAFHALIPQIANLVNP
jgi:XTP/dITP diphosphohydrolase